MNAVVADPRRRVLLVEDEAALARTLVDLLHAEGYQVETRADGALALDAACEEAHDLIVLDVMLPSMDGSEISDTLRKRGINTPIIMLTARDELGDKVGGAPVRRRRLPDQAFRSGRASCQNRSSIAPHLQRYG